MASSNPGSEITLRELYPHLTPAQLKEVEETLDRYIELSLRMYERIRQDPKAYRRFRALTGSNRLAMMQSTRSNSS